MLSTPPAPHVPPRPVTWEERLVRTVGIAAAVGAIVALLSITAVDPDLWGHVLYGLDILRDGSISAADPYSFTSDIPWINHEWLSEVLMAIAFRAGGTPGLVGLKVGLIALTVWLFVRTARLRSGVPWTIYLALLLVVSIFPLTQTIRPQLFSLLVFAALLNTVARYHVSNRAMVLAPAPVLLCVWANCHGGWIVGEVTLWLLVAPRLPLVPVREAVVLVVVLLVSAVAPLLNPYGTGLYAFLASTLSVARPEIGEWGSIWTFGIAGLLPWGAVIAVAAYAFTTGFARRHPVHAVTIVVFAISSMQVVRLVGFFGLVTCVLLSLDPPPIRKRPLTQAAPVPRAQAAIIAVMLCAIAVGALVWTGRSFTCLRMTGDWRPVADDVRYLRGVVKGGRLVTWFNWGQYAIWQLTPAFKVSFDGRRETVYSHEFIRRHIRFYRAEPGWEQFLSQINADAVWLPTSVPVVAHLESIGWHRVYRSPHSVVFTRPGLNAPHRESRQDYTDSCFPAP